MISIITLILILIFITYKSYKIGFGKLVLDLFTFCLIVSTFINLGGFILKIPYSLFPMVWLLTIMIVNDIQTKSLKLNRKVLIAALLLVLQLFAYIRLLTDYNLPLVIPSSTIMDDVYYGRATVCKAFFTNYNILCWTYLAIFLLLVCKMHDCFRKREFVDTICNRMIAAYTVFYILCVIEFLINNLIEPNLLRRLIFEFFGVGEASGISMLIRRGGIYGCVLTLSEPSYIAGCSIFMYSILFTRGLKEKEDRIVFILGIIVNAICGSSTSLLVLIMPMCLLIKEFFLRKSKRYLVKIVGMVSVIIIGSLGTYVAFKNQIQSIINYSISKINTYIGLQNIVSSSDSGRIREAGNSICYSAFSKAPILGLGIGTTRGYGIIPGALVSFGIMGVLIYSIYVYHMTNMKISVTNVFVLVLILFYFSSILAVDYMYYPAILMICIAMNKCVAKREKQ